MIPLPHSFSRLRNSGSRWRSVNSAIAGTFERYAITSTPSGARSPVEMSSGWTVATRASSESSIGLCSGGRLMLGPRGISIFSASASPAGEAEAEKIEIPRGPNIKRPPEHRPMEDSLEARVATVQPDDISTGDLAPDGVEVMAYRSNVPAIAEFTLRHRDPEFRKRLKEWGSGIIVAGDNYGQGSSREHAALAPLHLGVKAVVAKSFARIHRRNLIAQGIAALTFAEEG